MSHISVLVATCDRPDKLRATLESFERLADPPGWSWDLVVVDNGGEPGTRAVLEAFARRGTLPLTSLYEPSAGKAAALNTGLGHCRGDVVAFTDDDCLPPQDWLTIVAREFVADASLGALGGRVLLRDPRDGPVATRTGEERHTLAAPDQLFAFIIGCNMAFRRTVLEELGGFDADVGPGGPVPSGNDIDLVHRAFRAGHRIVYVPDVLVYHDHGRRSAAAIAAVNLRYVVGRGAFYCKYVLRGDGAVFRMAVREGRRLARDATVAMVRRRSPAREIRMLLALARGALIRVRVELNRLLRGR